MSPSNNASCKQSLHISWPTQVHHGDCLAPALLGPVHAVGVPLNDRGIHCVDLDLKAPQQALAFAPASKSGLRAEPRGKMAQRIERADFGCQARF